MKKLAALRTILLILGKMTACCAVFLLSAKCASGEQKKTVREGVEVKYAGTTTTIIRKETKGKLRAQTADVSFRVTGQLEAGEVSLRPGAHFKKGQLLWQINNSKAFDVLNRNKMALAVTVIGIMPDIRSRFPTEESKWSRFILGLKPENLVPELPKFHSAEERSFMTGKGIPERLAALQQEQQNMKQYFYLAPFNGSVAEVYKQPGNIQKKGEKTALLIAGNGFVMTASVPRENWVESFSYQLFDSLHIEIGNARTSQANPVDENGNAQLHYTLKPYKDRRNRILHNMPVSFLAYYRVPISGAFPQSALDGDKVQIIKKGKLETRQVTIVRKQLDFVYISGLQSGDAVVVSFRRKTDPNTYYFPK